MRRTRSATRGGGTFFPLATGRGSGGLALQFRHARHDGDRAGTDRELARLLQMIAVGVAELVQPIDELLFRHPLSASQLERPREHAREHGGALAVQARVDQP
jgi:hypothetical protein